ncbi:uncharacterized protein DS421_19g661600 [Arachis hypogaea]|uniref:Uncharacterized protein n=1 Tax=Arachis hypogaea TaxID=3818 RepID=A0A6B9VCM7_ARAHY|nr:uncharacterized protein DS421_19g661600 [Arachis hypogaea]
MENNQYFFVVVYSNGIVRHDDEGEFFESDNTVMLHTYRVDILDALKTVMLSNMGGVGTKEVGRVAYRFLYVLPNGGFTNRLFWIDGDHHVRVMFGVHAGLMPQHVMELYAAVHDVVVGMDSLLQLLKSCRSRRHRPHDSADDSDSEDNSTYVAGSGSSSDTMSEDEFVPETPNGSVGRFLLPLPLAIPWLSDVPSHYQTLNLDAMQSDDLLNTGDGEDYNTDSRVEFRIGHRFNNREAVLTAVKNYNIR